MKKSWQEISRLQMKTSLERYHKKLERLISANFKSRNMSDTKWRKLFISLSQADLNITRCNFKFVGESRIISSQFPTEHDLREEMFDDTCISVFLTYYKEIEWVEIPAYYHLTQSSKIPIQQDIKKAYELLQKIGEFEMTLTESGLTIFGYS